MLNFLSNFLSQGSQKQTVGICLTPGIGLEAVVIDKHKNVIVNYGRKKVEYNFSTREVQDYTQFKTALVELMDELKIAPKSHAYMILPNVYFDFIEVPPTIGPAEINTALLSKAEEFYLFKKEEPVSGYSEVFNPNGGTQKKLAYSSFQRSVVNEIKEIISEIGLQLVGLESAYSATLRGLFLTGLLDDIIAQNVSWTLMLVNTNSYTLFQMEGKDLLDYGEVPIAIKSFSSEEAYQAILSSSMQLLSNFDSTKLYIVSQTDDISAEVLKKQLEFDRDVVAINSNKYSIEPVIRMVGDAGATNYNFVTLASIGATNARCDFNLVLNTLAYDPSASTGVYFSVPLNGETIDITAEVVKKIVMALVVIVLVVFGTIYSLITSIDKKMQREYSKLNDRNTQLVAEANSLDKMEIKQEIDINAIIDEIAQLNVTANNFYDSIATDIPKNVWLTKYFNQEGNRIAIQGIAENIVDIYEYYKNLRIVSPQSDIKLTELKVVTASENEQSPINDLAINSDTDRLYSFEISNTQINFDEASRKAPVSENDIIIKSSSNADNVENPSGQMTPAR